MAKFVERFQSFRVGNLLLLQLAVPFDKRYCHPASLSTKTYGVTRAKLLRTSLSWQMLLLKRNSPVFVFKFIQVQSSFSSRCIWISSGKILYCKDLQRIFFTLAAPLNYFDHDERIFSDNDAS